MERVDVLIVGAGNAALLRPSLRSKPVSPVSSFWKRRREVFVEEIPTGVARLCGPRLRDPKICS